MNELSRSNGGSESAHPTSPRNHRRRLPGGFMTLTTGAAVLVAAGLLTGAAAALGATSAPAAVKPPKLSHQLCYTSTAKGFLKIPQQGTVRLINSFSPNGFLPKVGPAVLNCNPVKKILPTGAVFPITYPVGHLACFVISNFPAQPTPATTVINQFGSATLLLRQPRLLCLPTWKSLTGPPKAPAVQPPFLDHFTCYPIVATRGKFTPPAVMLQDEFTSKPVNADVKAVPTLFCLPTVKIIGKLPPNPIVHPHGSLVCFPVSQTPIKPRVWDLNQFGRAVVTIHRTALLCLPSKVVPSTAG